MTFSSQSSTERAVLHQPGDLIAALPAMLGFAPSESLVLVGFRQDRGHHRLAFTMRTDLPGADPPPPRPTELADYLRAQGCQGVIAVVVGGGAPSGAGLPGADLVDDLGWACADVGVTLLRELWTSRVARGEPWRCYDGCPDADDEGSHLECGCRGLVPDPAASPVAAAVVAAGQVIHADREELARIVAPADPEPLARRSALIARRITALERDPDSAPAAPFAAAGFTLVRDWLARASEGPPRLSDEDVVELCLALADPLVRDACCGFALDGRVAAAERLWIALVTAAPDPEAAEPALLLAVCALARGDGGLLSVALQRAQRAWPGHRFSEMLYQAVSRGADPDELLAMCAEAAGIAERMLGEGVART